MKTFSQSVEVADKNRNWVIVDAAGQTLGRLATRVADVLRGKNKVSFTPHIDCGDYVIVINAEKIELSGNKLKDKMYRHHTGYVGGVKEISAGDLRSKNPERMIEQAVWGMLPTGPLGRSVLKKLKVYRGSEHPHAAHNPVAMAIGA